MIISRITMGLGNQMFQYAAGLALSLEKQTTFKVDVSSYNNYSLRKYELDSFFEMYAEKAQTDEIAGFYYHHHVKRVWNKIFKKKLRILGLPYEESLIPRILLAVHDVIFPPYKRSTYIEPTYHFDKNFFDAGDNIYLQGYWMSWRYFNKYHPDVIKAFTVKRSLISHLEYLSNVIQNENSVSVHIRRTDFSEKRMMQLKGLLTLSYYYKAIDHLGSLITDIKIYCFSDDINWAKQNFQIQGLTIHYIDKSVTNTAAEDFYLMSKCKNNIIANSTFSWWAAYLNSNIKKIVIAPKSWYNQGSYNCKDIYPPSWVVI